MVEDVNLRAEVKLNYLKDGLFYPIVLILFMKMIQARR